MAIQSEKSGKELRKTLARTAQAEFKFDIDRPSVYDMIQKSNEGRLDTLIPIRHERMTSSPFAFYRGTADIMAYDLSKLPTTGLMVQAIGDAHLMNFGGFATPERLLTFDVNDFDETYKAPWEWDIKRLITSFILAARDKIFTRAEVREIATTAASSYRENILSFAQLPLLDLWYMKFDIETEISRSKNQKLKKYWLSLLQEADKETGEKLFYKLVKNVAGSFEIVDQPPLITHPFKDGEERKLVETFFKDYVETLEPDRQVLLRQYQLVDIAVKVVGIGSVGTRCYIALLVNDREEALFLQFKEARESVLEPYVPKQEGVAAHFGKRVVEGQRLVQAASDMFLGWASAPDGTQYYVRQLRDKKISVDVTTFNKEDFLFYAASCGKMLARAHAKTGDRRALAAYMGKNIKLDTALVDFAIRYADQVERDYVKFMRDIVSRRLTTEPDYVKAHGINPRQWMYMDFLASQGML